MPGRPLVGIVVLNYNGLADSIECLHSVERLAYEPMTVVVVDNASSGDDADELARRFPHVELMALSTNTGYAGGNNVGIEHLVSSGVDYVLVLNNDTIVPEDLLDVLVGFMELHQDCGACGPAMLYAAPSDLVFAAGGRVDYKGRCFNHLEYLPVAAVAEVEPFDVEFVHGSAIMLRAVTLARIGVFDERFFLNYEETDLCARLREGGWRVMVVPAATYWHKIGASIGRTSPAQHYYMTRNRLLFLAKRRRYLAVVISILLVALRLVREPDRAVRRAQVQAATDFVRGRFGPRIVAA